MKISEVNLTFVKPCDGLIAFASIVINDAVFLSGIAIYQKMNSTGHRITFPTRKSGNQVFSLFHPINRMAGQAIENAIFSKLNDVMNQSGDSNDRYDCLDPA